MKLRPTTVRAKLTILTVSTLGVLYLLLGFVVQLVAGQAILGSVDSELMRMGHGMAESPGFMRPPPPDDGPGPMGPPRDFPRESKSDSHPRVVWCAPDASQHEPVQPALDLDAVANVRRGAGAQLSTVSVDGQLMRILTIAVRPWGGNRVTAVMQVPHPLADSYTALDSLHRTLLVMLPIGLVLTAGASLFIVGRAIRPVRDITETAARTSADDLGSRLKVVGEDEFALLAQTINSMLARLQGSFSVQEKALKSLEEVVQQQRRFTADASHELKTPLTVIKAHAGLIAGTAGIDAGVQESAVEIDAATVRMTMLVQDLLLLARMDSGQLMLRTAPVDLRATASRAVDQVQNHSRVSVSAGEQALMVNGQAESLERVVVNLVSNACRHTLPGGKVTLSTSQEGRNAVLVVEDEGEGISPEHLPHVFERFYRADSARATSTGGTGLGLSICKGVVEAHGGTIEIDSRLCEGTRVSVRIPLLQL